MSMDLGGAKGGLKADINVTPLVDVMLVLLIIMMLVAPMLQQGVPVTLPEAGNTADRPAKGQARRVTSRTTLVGRVQIRLGLTVPRPWLGAVHRPSKR